jgi:RecQ family ATP-dependent DNA helicase
MAQVNAKLIALLAAAPNGLSRQELLTILRKENPALSAAQLDRVIRGAGDLIVERDNQLRAAQPNTVLDPDPSALMPSAAIGRPLRIVAVDTESVVRVTSREPYREVHIFQVGAVRFGLDHRWVRAHRTFNAYLSLPEIAEAAIDHQHVKDRYLVRREPAAVVLERFRSFVADADVLVAYNGTAHDFPLLDREFERAELQPLRPHTRVDGLYLALALWPVPPRQHRLRQLTNRLHLDVGEALWHDALDDAKVLSILIEFGAWSLARRDLELRSLIAAVGSGSDAWTTLLALMPARPGVRTFSSAQVTDLLSDELQRLSTRTAASDSRPLQRDWRPPIVPEWLRNPGTSVTVDVHALAEAAKGGSAEPRPAQREMVEVMRHWIHDGVNGLVEAPTGTGKSYALLAIALEWLAADPRNRVLISTYTKQLQSQFAGDIDSLAKPGALPELVDYTDMVKGARNRLSMRALIIALTELTSASHSRRRRSRFDYAKDPRFRELVLYLFLRLIEGGRKTEIWESRSVDAVDVPAFFIDYCGRRLSLYLLALSQALNGELEAPTGGLASYATTVREALLHHRLVIANHALLLSHIDDFEDIGEHTLLLVDEAHALESAATAALSPTVDSPAIEALAVDVHLWLDDQPDPAPLRHVVAALRELDRFLDSEELPRAAITVLSRAGSDPLGKDHLRKVTVASPVAGAAHVREMKGLKEALQRVSRYLLLLHDTLWQLPPGTIVEQERYWAMVLQLKDLRDALHELLRHFNAAIAPSLPPSGQQAPFMASEDAAEGNISAAATGTLPDLGLAASRVPEMAPNHVIWAEELDEWQQSRGYRSYQFRTASSPIELGREHEYRNFTSTFRRVYYVSATLRVAGKWDFIRERLALPAESVNAIPLSSPFDAAAQARLVCFEDFPSWSEQSEAAIRTVAHQVSKYAQVLAQENRNGAMVLTTSKAAAAGIAEATIQLRTKMGGAFPITATELLGNQRAVDTFREVGGILVGTKGLWQGVDVAQPERLRLVWINKLPFAAFNDPIIAARKEVIRDRAEARGIEDPDAYANETYYLPLAALELRQAVGRLIRSRDHRGVIIISDRKLAGPTRLRRLYREVFLGSLDPGLVGNQPETDNVMTMAEGWRRIWDFFASEGILEPGRAAELSTAEELDRFTQLPESLAIRQAAFTREEEQSLRAQGRQAFAEALRTRAAEIAGYLRLQDEPVELKDKQLEAIDALADGKDLLAILPTGYGKSFVFQLPALALPGVTIVVSPLVSLMTDQALALNKTIGGAVRALVAPMRESNSRTGKTEIHQQLTDPNCQHGIRLVYLSPERLCQRQFQDLVRTGVKQGIIRRIAIDEAHTFVQWGDDFRPSFRRAERFLRELKGIQPELQLIAVTATANKSVREGLRRAIFGLAPGIADPPTFACITANPIRPELAIYRRTLGRGEGSRDAVAGLLERATEHIADHAIFYCLTIREVDAHHAHLRDYFAGQPKIIHKYHGRMTEVEKTSIANEFRSAPKRGEEGFLPMIVVATSAFGLGIDRPDIRTVFVVSPPTDLAALYQQLGRAGRDQVGSPVASCVQTTGLVLATNRAFETIRFMTRQQGVDTRLLARIAASILHSEPPLDLRDLAGTLVAEDHKAGRMREDEAASRRTEDLYHTAVVRVFAELASADLLEDRGDFPAVVAINRGELTPDTTEMDELVNEILNVPMECLQATRLEDLYRRLAPDFAEEIPDPGAVWTLLLNLHTLGYLDVSQRPNIDSGYLTSFRVNRSTLTESVLDGLGRRQRTVEQEVDQLRDWFESPSCLNEGLSQYFSMPELPVGTCETPLCRCSVCLNRLGFGNEEPALLTALSTHRPRPAASEGVQTRRAQELLDRYVERLLWQNPRGLSKNIILSVISGDEFFYNRAQRRRVPLWPRHLSSSVRNARPGLKLEELSSSLERLEGDDVITRDGGLWMLTRYIEGRISSDNGSAERDADHAKVVDATDVQVT